MKMMKSPRQHLVWHLILIALFVACLAPVSLAQKSAPGFPGLDQMSESQQFGDSRDRVSVSVQTSQAALTPGGRAVIAVIFDHQPGWHIWSNEGNTPEGMAEFDGAIHTAIDVKSSASADGGSVIAHAAQIQWPAVHAAKADLGEGPREYAVFTGHAVAYVPVTVSETAPAGETQLDVVLTFQSCNEETCLAPVFDLKLPVHFKIASAGDANVATEVPRDGVFADFNSAVFDQISKASNPLPSEHQNAATIETLQSPPPQSFFGIALPQATGAIGLLLLIALSIVGGFILNLTPCVLPIIPIKILTISQHAGSHGRTLKLGMWMALGVVAFWAAIGIPAALFSAAADPSRVFGIWWVTLGIGVLIAIMGVGIMGLFAIQLPAAVYAVNPRADTAWGSFAFGIMTAVLGLPCFGFVAGALLAGASTLPPIMVMLIFTSIGIGMAAPYLILSANPALVNRIPRTGPASELVKQVMGLLLLAAAAYFIGSGFITLALDYPYIAKQLHWWVAAVFAILAGLWLVMRTFQITPKAAPRLAFLVLGFLISVAAIWFANDRTARARDEWSKLATSRDASEFVAGAWNEYTPERFASARKAGHVVVLDFTASWCLTCQVLKATVLDPEPVKSEFAKPDVVVFSVDLSSLKSPGWDHLHALNKTGIPLLAIYAPAAQTPWMANNYTADQVISAVEEARQKTASAQR